MTAEPLAPTEPDIVVLPDPDAVAAAAAERIADTLRAAVTARGRADWATTGGSSVAGIYRNLAYPPLRDRVPWDAVHLWWGDDRYVSRDHPLSNVAPADQVLLSTAARSGQSGMGEDADDVRRGRDPGAPIPTANIHPFATSQAIGENRRPAWAAARYAAELEASGIEVRDGWPVFDLVLLGIGPDGHLLSVFPGSPALDDATSWAMAVPAPTHVEPHVSRVTLNPRVLDVARSIVVVTLGRSKADVLHDVFGATRDPRALPAQLARRRGATWLLDGDAASKLPARTPAG